MNNSFGAQFTKDHIDLNRASASPILAEQVVYCLELVAELSRQDFPFCFKGGNSQLVLLEDAKRFSIDVDITTDVSRETLTDCVVGLAQEENPFTEVIHRPHKTKPWIPLASFQLYYASHFAAEEDAFIMLDGMLLPSLYPTKRVPVRFGELYSSDEEVTVPTVASLMGDKLLTLGPETLGIPLGKGKGTQRIKHIFDVAHLARHEPSLPEIRQSMDACLAQENELQKTEWTLDDVRKDTLAFLSEILEHEEEPTSPESPGLAETVAGREPFAQHLLAGAYPWQALREDAHQCAQALSTATTTEPSRSSPGLGTGDRGPATDAPPNGVAS